MAKKKRGSKKTAKKAKAATKKRRRPSKSKQEKLNVEITLVAPTGSDLMTPFSGNVRPRADNASRFRADPAQLERSLDELVRLGFDILAVSRASVSVECTPQLFTKVFGTKLATKKVDTTLPAIPSMASYLSPAADATWEPPPPLRGLVERAYIQKPFVYFETPIPPQIDYHHVRVPGDLALLTNATKVHREGVTGAGVKVAMIDSGFYIQHPFYEEMGYNMSRMLGPGATNLEHDENGHGTAEAANILAIAPDVNFIGVKTGGSLAASFKKTVQQSPDIISISLGWDLRDQTTGLPQTDLPGFLNSLETEIADAVSDGITVVISAGNGHIGFPGQHPDVISAGGAFIDADMSVQASDYASAFQSKIYPGRSVPDLAGLVGLRNNGASYIMLPVEPNDAIDQGAASDVTSGGNPKFPDGTQPNDGWCVISGTSAAAPQLAGVCALLKQANPGLTPSEIKAVLKLTAADVTQGNANGVSNPVLVGGNVQFQKINAAAGPDGATGHGLVDAFAALRQV